MSWSRREFIDLLGSSIALVLAGCSRNPDSGGTEAPPPMDAAPVTPGLSPADRGRTEFLEKIRRAVRTSPDHLAARAEAIIATRDPTRAAAFVREHIAVLPASQATISGLWGPRGTLRSGSGSLRDRADLLASMLTAMGRRAVVRETACPHGLSVDDLFAPIAPAGFAPDRAAIDPLFDERKLPRPADSAFAPDREGARAVEELTQSLWSMIPADKRAATQVATLERPERIAVVEFDDGGRRRVAAAIADFDFVDVAPDGLHDPGATDYPKVELAVLAAFNPPMGATLERGQLHELVRASWPVDQLCGRRLTLSFAVPGGGIRPPTDPWDQPTRIPVLRLSDPRGSDEGTARLAVGNLVTMFGGTFAVAGQDASGTPQEVIGPFGPMTLASRRDEVAGNAASISARVDASAFPDVRLQVTLRDQLGKSVNGLAAPDFVVTENRQPQSAFVLSDQASARARVLVLRDGSGSTSEFLPTPAARTAFDRAIATALVQAAQKTPFDVQVIRVDGAPIERDWAPPDAARMIETMAQSSTSDGWNGLGRGVPASRAAVAVLISDNVMTDTPATVPALRAQLKASGTPLIVIPIGSGGEATTADLVALSGGRRVAHNDPALAAVIATMVSQHLTATPPATYELRYRARNVGATPASREVAVALAAKPAIRTEVEYSLPVPGERTLPAGLAGLYLKITANGITDIRRLGGVDVNYAGVPIIDSVDAAALSDAANAAFGITTVAFEPPVSSSAEMLDDVLRALIGLDPFIAAIPKGDPEIVRQVGHLQPTPTVFVPLFQPIGVDPSRGVGGLRIGIQTESALRTASGQRGIVSTVDVPPAFNVVKGRGSGSTAFRRALTESLAISVRESQLSPDSAAARLAGQQLRYLAPYAAWAPLPGMSAAVAERLGMQLNRYYNYHRFVASIQPINSFWIVDPATGSATAIDAFGRGGMTFANPNPVANTGACEGIDTDLMFRLDLAAALIAAFCTLVDWQPGSATQKLATVASNTKGMTPNASTILTFACVGATVEGVYSLAEGSFKHPVDLANVKFAVNAFGAVTGVAALAGAKWGSPFAGFSLGVRVMISLMLSGIGLLGLPCLGDGSSPEPAPKAPSGPEPDRCAEPSTPKVGPAPVCK